MFVFTQSFVQALGCILASKKMHNLILRQIMHCPVYFFDITPIGRIVNRFSSDMDTIDNVLPRNLQSSLNCFFVVKYFITNYYSFAIQIVSNNFNLCK